MTKIDEVVERKFDKQAIPPGMERTFGRDEFRTALQEVHDAAVAEMRDEIEAERMRLAACGVVANANTPDSAKRARENIHPNYHSGSLEDVMRAVDQQMALRAAVAEAGKDAERYRYLREHISIKFKIASRTSSRSQRKTGI